ADTSPTLPAFSSHRSRRSDRDRSRDREARAAPRERMAVGPKRFAFLGGCGRSRRTRSMLSSKDLEGARLRDVAADQRRGTMPAIGDRLEGDGADRATSASAFETTEVVSRGVVSTATRNDELLERAEATDVHHEPPWCGVARDLRSTCQRNARGET